MKKPFLLHNLVEQLKTDERLQNLVKEASLIIVSLGTNDMRPTKKRNRIPISAIEASLLVKEAIDLFRDLTKAKIAFLELPPLISEDLAFQLKIPNFNANLETITSEHGIDLIKLTTIPNQKDMIESDGYHIKLELAREIGGLITKYLNNTSATNDSATNASATAAPQVRQTRRVFEHKYDVILHKSIYDHLTQNSGTNIKAITKGKPVHVKLTPPSDNSSTIKAIVSGATSQDVFLMVNQLKDLADDVKSRATCRFYMQGRCRLGSKCPNLHTRPAEGSRRPNRTPNNRSSGPSRSRAPSASQGAPNSNFHQRKRSKKRKGRQPG